MLRAEDLMIGDWVMDTRSNTPLRVNPFLAQLEVPEWKPIPLTPEILEKNTSESNKNVFGGMNYTLNTDYFIENRGDRFCLSRRMAGHKYSTFWVCDIHYVHELQHALRLCKIDLEINI